jgi:diacylglycerol kinase (ATP)
VADKQEASDAIPLTILNNYFSIGVDAAIALRFHRERESNPRKFKSRFVTCRRCPFPRFSSSPRTLNATRLLTDARTKNKVFYAQYGAAEAFRSTFANLNDDLELYVDNAPAPCTLPTIQGLVFVNITSEPPSRS